MARRHLLFLLLFLLPVTPGFVCASRAERMEGELDALRIQFEEIQQRINNDQAQVTEMILRADVKLAELAELQGQAHDLVTRNSVDLSLQLESTRTELAELRGRMDSQDRTLTQLGNDVRAIVSALGATDSGKTIVLPKEKEALFAFATEKRAANRNPEARAAYSEFIARYPDDSRVPATLADLCLLFSVDGMHQDAIATARTYLKTFPDGPQRNDVIATMGDSAAALGNCDVAQKAYQTLVEVGHKNAKKRLSEISAQCK